MLKPRLEFGKVANAIGACRWRYETGAAKYHCHASSVPSPCTAGRAGIRSLLYREMSAVRPRFGLWTLAAVLAALPAVAAAAPCYMLFDRYDNIVYRSTISPIDLSDQGNAARDALRRRGEYLLSMESDRCASITYVFGAAGSKTLSIDETVGGFPAESPRATPAGARPRRATIPAPAASDQASPATSK